ncbi:molybdate ABC transporter permease subunit [soil metagenome]
MFGALTAFESQALLLSIRVALVAVALTLPIGLALALVLARGRFPGRWIVEALVNLPLVLPPVVTGLALLMVFGVHGPVGAWLKATFGITLAFHWIGAALAAAVMALPLVVRPIRLSIESVDRGLEQAAATLGAPPLAVLVRITLPLALPGLIAGGLLGFARAFGEFGATVTFAGSIVGETQTLPVAIYAALQTTEGETSAIRLALISVVISVGALLATEAFNRRTLQGRGER